MQGFIFSSWKRTGANFLSKTGLNSCGKASNIFQTLKSCRAASLSFRRRRSAAISTRRSCKTWLLIQARTLSAGEEPTDNVTRQYNETMKRLLPRYGIEFCEIPRKTFGEEIISASKVREALQVGDFDKIKRLVPSSTLRYLRGGRPARINIKLVPQGEGDFKVSVSDDKAKVWKPEWFNKGGIGYQIQSHAESLELVAKVTADGQIQLWLMGVDVRYPNDSTKRVPYWIDYTKLVINGEIIFNKLTPAWHDKAFRYNMNVKAGDELKIQIEHLAHNDDN